jgi:hypothetical protein
MEIYWKKTLQHHRIEQIILHPFILLVIRVDDSTEWVGLLFLMKRRNNENDFRFDDENF